jgi:hypothetical protein
MPFRQASTMPALTLRVNPKSSALTMRRRMEEGWFDSLRRGVGEAPAGAVLVLRDPAGEAGLGACGVDP